MAIIEIQGQILQKKCIVKKDKDRKENVTFPGYVTDVVLRSVTIKFPECPGKSCI
jgi:hypothetical protein